MAIGAIITAVVTGVVSLLIVGGVSTAIGGARFSFLKRSKVIPGTKGMRALSSPWPIEKLGEYIEDFVKTWERLDPAMKGKIQDAMENCLITFVHDNKTYVIDGFNRKVRGYAQSPRHVVVVTWDNASMSNTALSWELIRLVTWQINNSPGSAIITNDHPAIKLLIPEMSKRWP